MPKISQETKDQTARVVKEVTGRDIKDIIPEPALREKLFKMLDDFKAKRHMSPTLAIEALRKYIRNYQIAKEAVKVIFILTYPKNKFKDYVPRDMRNALYFQYSDIALENEKIEAAVRKTKKDLSDMKDLFILINKISECSLGQNIIAIFDEANSIPKLVNCKVIEEEIDTEKYITENTNLIERANNSDYSAVIFKDIKEIHELYTRISA